jgi:DNA-binding Xre family transcriptional regulator
MIRLTVKEAAIRRGITNAHGLQLAIGLSPTVAADLWNPNGTFPRLQTLNRICDKWGCPLSELVTWAPEKKKRHS